MMQKILRAGAAIVGIVSVQTQQALAADLSPGAYAPPPIVAPVMTWTGAYIGGQAGYAMSVSKYTYLNGDAYMLAQGLDPGFEDFTHKASSFVGGGHLGAQGQWGNAVVGIEAAGSWMRLNDTQTGILQAGGYKRTLTLDNMVTAVGKLGLAIGSWMIYAKGGWAATDISTFTINPTKDVWAKTTGWAGGWTAGGGVDFMIHQNWIVGVELNYYTFSHNRTSYTNILTPFSYSDSKADVYAALGRVSYKFGS